MTRLSTDANLVEILLAYEPLTNLTGQRIWGGVSEPPRGADYKPPKGAAVCLQTITGTDDYTDLLRHELVQVNCYAETRAKADTLAGVLHIVLQNTVTAKMKWARRTLTPRVLAEPETGWIYAFTQYATMIHQEA